MATSSHRFTYDLPSLHPVDPFQESDIEQVVKGIHLCGYMLSNDGEFEQDRSPTNHWNMFLELSGQRSVKVDVIPSYGNGEGIGLILLESKEYVMTNGSVKSITFFPGDELRVKEVDGSHHAKWT